MVNNLSNDLVRSSRAGDAFHYRWAARRCLKLVYPNTSLDKIYIEGSSESKKHGEYVIDVSEYSKTYNGEKRKIDYYQLKHTSVRGDKAITLSELKKTIDGFAARFKQHFKRGKLDVDIYFYVITNRKISEGVKKNILAISENKPANYKFKDTLTKYTKLTDKQLSQFCSILHLNDSEGNFVEQKNELQWELASLSAGTIENTHIENLIALVNDRALPNKHDGCITCEDVLKRLGINSTNDLFPAPPLWNEYANIIDREQYSLLISEIKEAKNHVILHATGGVGKSIFCQHFASSITEYKNSLAFVYDCFGAGKYRSRSQSRHHHSDGLVQIINELAFKGLCAPLIGYKNDSEKNLMRTFLERITKAVTSLRAIHTDAILFLVIDAADNAAMAAEEIDEACFAKELLKETFPEGCKLILTSRTERVSVLSPSDDIIKIEIPSFSTEESHQNLRQFFPKCTNLDGAEFHRLTMGNPRVQSLLLNSKHSTTRDLLTALGPDCISVDEQIDRQLRDAVKNCKDLLPDKSRVNIDNICIALSYLPPNIPLDVLSAVSGVDIKYVLSFISDIGVSLWCSGSSVHFRDEPTETWFRDNYQPFGNDAIKFIGILEPISETSAYVSALLPQLYLQAGQYDKLIEISLSDQFIPKNNLIDERAIRISRLQFAFKAAIKASKNIDAIKIAMRAGEEMSGEERQIDLFKDNIDLLLAFQSKEQIQDIAFNRRIKGDWAGSENVYAASLLSGIVENLGESRGVLRSSLNWLVSYYQDLKKQNDNHPDNLVTQTEIAEFCSAYYNINGTKECVDFLKRFTSKPYMFGVVKLFVKRLLDAGKYDAVDEFIANCKDEKYFILAAIDELMKIGRYAKKDAVESCLKLFLKKPRSSYQKDFSESDAISPAILSLAESCLHYQLCAEYILKLIYPFISVKTSRLFCSFYSTVERSIIIRAHSIRMVLEGLTGIDIDDIIPDEIKAKKQSRASNGYNDFRETFSGLFPWSLLRAKVIYDNNLNILELAEVANKESVSSLKNRYDSRNRLPQEIAEIQSSIFVHLNDSEKTSLQFYEQFLKSNPEFYFNSKISVLRASVGKPKLADICQEIEASAHAIAEKYNSEDRPDEITDMYISLARAVLSSRHDDARYYFNEALNFTLKCGIEAYQRWDAIVSLARRASATNNISNELAYRYVRCTELVGDYIDKEKAWDRCEVLRICSMMSPEIAISTLSRWRDRGVGRFEYLLETLIIELISSTKITPSVGWALTRFILHSSYDECLSECLKYETDAAVKKQILEDAVHLLQLNGAGKEQWDSIASIAKHNNINNEVLDNAESYYKQNSSVAKKEEDTFSRNKIKDVNWSEIVTGDINCQQDFEDLLNRACNQFKSDHEDNNNWYKVIFLSNVIPYIHESNIWQFVEIAITSKRLNSYEARTLLSAIPVRARNYVSSKQKWNNIIECYGKEYARELANKFAIQFAVADLTQTSEQGERLVNAIIEGFALGEQLFNSSQLFGYTSIMSSILTPDEAKEALEYSITRFENYLKDDYGDGLWDTWLSTSSDIYNNIAGFIWAGLGDPDASTRWSAMHCVQILGEYNCGDILNHLIDWFNIGESPAYIGKGFRFYTLHARQYLLIALSKISFSNPSILLQFSNIFPHIAINEVHFMIQHFAKEIVLNLERYHPNTYSSNILTIVNGLCTSQAPILKASYDYQTDTPWHRQGKSFDSKFYFGWDIGNYWYSPLGNVFGVSEKQISDLASDIIVNKWKEITDGAYKSDPRISQWDSNYYSNKIYHHHGSYPEIDNFNFYLSYHAMMVVAAMLIREMPVVDIHNWGDNPWQDWYNRHMLTFKNGNWISDIRTAVPLHRPKWIEETLPSDWVNNEIDIDYFSKSIDTDLDGNSAIILCGAWHEKSSSYIERYSVISVLATQKELDANLDSLLNDDDESYNFTLQTIRNEIKLPDNLEFGGYINTISKDKGVDEFDPYADCMKLYQPYALDNRVFNIFNLATIESDTLSYFDITNGELMIAHQVWSSYQFRDDDYHDQDGTCIVATKSFLKNICQKNKISLLFEVSISREQNEKYSKDDKTRSPLVRKYFLLSYDKSITELKLTYYEPNNGA